MVYISHSIPQLTPVKKKKPFPCTTCLVSPQVAEANIGKEKPFLSRCRLVLQDVSSFEDGGLNRRVVVVDMISEKFEDVPFQKGTVARAKPDTTGSAPKKAYALSAKTLSPAYRCW